jgi:hypothetical protein
MQIDTESESRVGWNETLCTFRTCTCGAISQVIRDIELILSKLVHLLESLGKTCYDGADLHNRFVGRVEDIVVD